MQINNIKQVSKHWGKELWITDGTNSPYALKQIHFKANNRTSLQVHRNKFETNYVLSGTGKLYYSETLFDIDGFLLKGMTSEELLQYENTLKVLELHERVSFNIIPGIVHRVVATTDLTFIEASTCELDDVIRLQDDQNRTHGKIKYEHE